MADRKAATGTGNGGQPTWSALIGRALVAIYLFNVAAANIVMVMRPGGSSIGAIVLLWVGALVVLVLLRLFWRSVQSTGRRPR